MATRPPARRSTRRGRAGPTTSRFVVAADGGARHAAALGVGDRPVGRRRRLARRRRARGARGRRRPDRTVPPGQGRVGHRARRPGGAPTRRPTGSSSSAPSAAPRLDHALANIGLPAPDRHWPRRPSSSSRTLARVALAAGAAGRRRPGRAGRSSGEPATWSRCCRWAPGSTGSPPTASSTRSTTSRCPAGSTRGLSNVRRALGRGGHAPVGACCSSSNPLLRSRHEHARSPATSRPRSPSPTRPARSTGCPTSAAAGRSSTSTRRTTPPAARSRRASSATRTRRSTSAAPTSGGSARRAPASKRTFREKFDLPFTLLADEQHAVAEAYGSWVEKQNYGKTYWGTARTTFLVDPDGRIARVWPKVKPEGHAAEVLAALDDAAGGARRVTARESSEASLVGGDERSLGRKGTAASCALQYAGRTREAPMTGPWSGAGAGRDRVADPVAREPHAWRPARFMVIAAHPDDAEFGPAGTAARWIDAGRRGLARVLHQRRPGRRGPDADPLELAALRETEQRAAAADRRLRGCHLPPPAGRRAGQRPRAARAAGPRDPDLPAGRGLRDGPGDALLRRRRRQPHRPPRRRHRRGRRRLSGGAQPDGLPGAGSVGLAAHRVRRLYLFWSNRPSAWVDITVDDRTQGRRPAGPCQPDQRPGRARDAHPRVGRRGRRGRSASTRPRPCA